MDFSGNAGPAEVSEVSWRDNHLSDPVTELDTQSILIMIDQDNHDRPGVVAVNGRRSIQDRDTEFKSQA